MILQTTDQMDFLECKYRCLVAKFSESVSDGFILQTTTSGSVIGLVPNWLQPINWSSEGYKEAMYKMSDVSDSIKLPLK